MIREAIRKEGMVALAKIVFTSREHIIALEARGKGMMGVTLRYPYEVRAEDEYFDGIEDEKIPKDMLDLAVHIVEHQDRPFQAGAFQGPVRGRAEGAAAQEAEGREDRAAKESAPSNVINLMDALRQSVKAGGARATGKAGTSKNGSGRRAPARSAGAAKKTTRSSTRHKRAS